MTGDPAVWWADGEYELVAESFSGIHDRLVERLAPRAGERFLDVGTGTGEIALRAAAAGAHVTAVDLAPAMLARARRRSDEVDWRVADAQELPFARGAFDVLASCFAVIFARDAQRAASELTRVVRGRLGITTWALDEGLDEMWKPFAWEPLRSDAWSSPGGIRALLPDFDLDVEEGTWWLEGESSEALWEWMGRAVPPHREGLRQLDVAEVAELRDRFVELHERHRDGDRIRYPRRYFLAVGARR